MKIEKARYGVYLPVILIKEFQKKCIDKGTNMSEEISKLVKEWLKR